MIRLSVLVPFLFLAFIGSAQVDTTILSQLDDVNIVTTRAYEKGVTTLSRKQFLTMAGALEDPTRLLIKSPGVSTANDQANSVIYHGLPAQYHQWSLYGARVLNPNHNSNAGTISDLPSSSAGGVNMLSGQVIGSLEFNGNPSPKSLGSVAGMSDVKLRNPYKTGLTTNLSLIGLEAGYDIVKGADNFMINYRYSTVGLLTSGLGLDFGGEEINYQDLTTKYSIKRKSGDYSFYLSAGANSNRKDSLHISSVTEFKDLQKTDYTAKILLGGVNHKYENDQFVVNNTINASRRVVDKITEANIATTSTIQYENRATLLSLNHNNKRKFKKWNIGYQIETWLEDQFLLKFFPSEFNGVSIERKIDRTSFSLQPAVIADVKILKNLSVSSTIGMTYQNVGLSNTDYIGHLAINYKKQDLTIHAAISRSAQNQPIELALDSFNISNQISENFSLSASYKGFGISGYYHRLGSSSTRDGLYGIVSLQNLDNLPINYNDLPNILEDPIDINVRGVSLFMEKEVFGVVMSSNLTLQSSGGKYIYTGILSDEKLPLDYGHILNIRLQKEWKISTEKRFGISSSIHKRGGERQLQVDLSNSLNWGFTAYSYGNLPDLQLSDYFRADLRIYYKPSKRSTISLDIQNVTNRENDAYYYYEPLTESSKLKTQLGMIPILSWRVDW